MSYYPPSPQPVPQQNSTTALLSLIAGIAGLTIFPGIGSIIAVILGHMAKGEIARSGGTLGGGGAATWGLVLGYIGVAGIVLGVCIAGLAFAGVCTIPFLSVLFSGDVSWLPALPAA
jgi:hypothetical protein